MRYLLTLIAMIMTSLAFVTEASNNSYLTGYKAGFDAGTDIVQKSVNLLINRPGVKKCYKPKEITPSLNQN